jgi:DNA polymerase-3 subunit epsilon
MKIDRDLVFLDLETTSADPCECRIIDLGVVVLSPDGSRREWNQRFNPLIPIPAESTAIHGISDADVATCPSFAEWGARIKAALTDRDIAGYNLKAFDLIVIDQELRRCGMKLNLDGIRVIDCLAIFRKKEPRTLSDAVLKYCGRAHEGAHGALADAAATADVLAGQLAAYPDLDAMTIEEVAEFSRSSEGKEADLAGKLYYDKDGVLRFNFGKHKDKPVLDNCGYVNWMLNKGEFPGSTCDLLMDVLGNQR